jgi:hypothetical protein
VKRISTTLVDKRNDEIVAADLIDGVTQELVEQTEDRWTVPRLQGALRCHRSGRSVPEHFHWDWRRKAPKLRLLAYRCFGLECQGEMQGLMMVNTASCVARLEPDRRKPLVYVDYLESAPWNLQGLVDEPRFGAVGVRLFEAAVRFSLTEGFGGRVGLHALPQAEDFYGRACQMTRVEPDPNVQGLWWFELTAEQARAFLGEGE